MSRILIIKFIPQSIHSHTNGINIGLSFYLFIYLFFNSQKLINTLPNVPKARRIVEEHTKAPTYRQSAKKPKQELKTSKETSGDKTVSVQGQSRSKSYNI
jgi:membrane-anchored glycerophosphoryl diester phosphodiesterase (GDPDase)